MINNKYKTQMCRHWEQSKPLQRASKFFLRCAILLAGNCQLGPKCHFAHGKDDLRSLTDVKSPSLPIVDWNFI